MISLMAWNNVSHAQTQVGLRDVTMMPYALESATNVNRLSPEVRQMYNNMKGVFPKKGDLYELSDSYLVSLTAYAGEFCRIMIATDMKNTPDKRWAHGSVDFNIPPHNWTEPSVNSLLDRYAELFWQRPLDVDEREILRQGLGDLLIELPKTNKSAEGILLSACAAFSTAPQFIFIGGRFQSHVVK